MRRLLTVWFLLILGVQYGTAQWQSLQGPPGGYVNDVEYNASNGDLYTIVNDRVFSRKNGSNTWTQLSATSNLYIYDLLIDGSNLYGVSYSNLYKSTDDGQTWTRLNISNTFNNARHVVKVGSALMVYGYGGLFASSDEGVNWSQISATSTFHATSNTGNDLYFSTTSGIFRHAAPASGQTWDESKAILVRTTSNYSGDLITYGNDVFAVADNDLIKSSDNGASWTSVRSTISDYVNDGRWAKTSVGLYFFSNSKAYFKTNTGTNWAEKTYPTQALSGTWINCVKFINDQTAYAGASTDGILRTSDASSTWTGMNEGINLNTAQSIIVTSSNRIIVASNTDARGFWYNDSGTWAYKSLALPIRKIVKLQNNTLLALGYNFLQYSQDNGNTWTQSSTAVLSDVSHNATFSTLYFGVKSGTIARSPDGINWTDYTITGLPTSFSINSIAIDNAGRIYLSIYEYSASPPYSVYRIDGISTTGTTGTATKLTIPRGVQDESYFSIQSFFVSNDKIYVSTYNHIYISADQGSSWKIVNFSKSSLIPMKKGSQHAICAGTNGLLYITQDDGKTWTSTTLAGSGQRYFTTLAEDASGDYYGAGYNLSVMKFTDELILPASSLPPFIDFNWQPTNGPYGGYINKLRTDNANNTYALGNGSLYKAPLNLSAWTKKGPAQQYLYDFDLDKPNNKLYALTYQQIMLSSDGGDTWQVLNNEAINQRQILRRCSNGDIAMAAGGKIYVSTDGGVNFGTAKYTTSGKWIRDIVVTPSNSIIVILEQNTNPYERSAVISTDRGSTWNSMNLNATNSSYAYMTTGGDGKIYSTAGTPSVSTDNGATWTSIVGDLPTTTFASPIFVSADNNLYGFVYGNAISLYKSVNGGVNWVKLGNHSEEVSSITWVGTRITISSRSGVSVSEDDGVTFAQKNVGITPTDFSDLHLTGTSSLFAITGNRDFFVSTDGNEWSKKDVNGIFRVFHKPDGTLMGSAPWRLYTSSDQGVSWTEVSNFPTYFQKVVTVDGSKYYAHGGTKDVYLSQNLSSWTKLDISGLPDNASAFDFEVDGNGLFYFMMYNYSTSKYELYQISFGDASLLSQFENPRSIKYRDNKLFVYESTGLISVTSDGSTWSQLPAPFGNKLIIADNNYYFVPQYGGSLWLSRDQGSSWQNVGLASSTNNVVFEDVVVNEYDGYAYAALTNSVVRKSANIVLVPETVPPTVSSLVPANNANGVDANVALKITFNETCKAVSGKKIRIYDTDNPDVPEQIIDATAGTQNAKTFSFTPTTALNYEESYFVIVDVGAFTDIFGNAFAGIQSQTAWRFTIMPQPDNTEPVITFSPPTPAFTKGNTNKLSITVTDEGGSGLNTASIKVYYRGIMSDAAFTPATMTSAGGNSYEITVPDSWMDDLGLEYYFEASDNQGNLQQSPDDPATGIVHRGYFGYADAARPALPSSALSFGGKVENYRMFSVPHKLSNAQISVVFDELSSLTVKKDFRILTYNTSSGQYSEYPTLSTISRGTGYWVNIKDPIESLVVENATTPENNKSQLFSMTLKPGWNQIGNPYPFTISWNAVRNEADNTNIGVLKTFNGTSYVDDDKLNPFEGGFVLLGGSANAVIEIPFSAKTTSGRLADRGPDFEGGWVLPMTISNSLFATSGGVGMHPDARVAFDNFDDALPPALFDIPELKFPINESKITSFSRDIVPPQEKHVWQFEADGGGFDATMSWTTDAISSTQELYLLDESTQSLTDMRSIRSYAVAKENSSFRIYFGFPKDEIAPTRISLGAPYPNPFEFQSSVSVTLPEGGAGTYSVNLDVYDFQGRLVENLLRGNYKPGFYNATWELEKNDVRASAYLLRLSVSNSAGQTTVTRKLISKK